MKLSYLWGYVDFFIISKLSFQKFTKSILTLDGMQIPCATQTNGQ